MLNTHFLNSINQSNYYNHLIKFSRAPFVRTIYVNLAILLIFNSYFFIRIFTYINN